MLLLARVVAHGITQIVGKVVTQVIIKVWRGCLVVTVFSPVQRDPVLGRARYSPVLPECQTGPDPKQEVLDWTGLVRTSPFLLMVVIQIRY